MSLSQIVHKFIEKERLFLRDDNLLCAVSGGLDSMVMLDLLRTLGYPLAVGHVNYMLRGIESHDDQALVATYCKDHNIVFHTKTLSEAEVNELKSGNLQEKARKLRYKWLGDVLAQNNYNCICLAHHQQDQAETFILNALRGSGMTGLRAIQSISGKKRRPILSLSKEELNSYAHTFQVPFREDRSNKSNDYDRNFVRNQVIPSISKRWQEGTKTLATSAELLSRDYALLNDLIEGVRHHWIKPDNGILTFGPIDEFNEQPSSQNLAYHLLKKYGFNAALVDQMINDLHQSGKLFYSATHEALYDRNHILLQKRKDATKIEKTISNEGVIKVATGQLTIEKSEYIELSKDPNSQFIDAASFEWPLVLRSWKPGDILKPLGMEGHHKNVSDILIDRKLTLLEKRRQLVLTDATGEILWLIGQQLSESCKLKKESQEYLKLTWQGVD